MPEAWSEARARAVIGAERDRAGALLPIFHRLQDEFGWISDAAVALVAEALNLSRAEVHGTLTFYRDFRRLPPARRILKLCRAEACQARGGRESEKRIEAALGLRMGETLPDGSLSLEPVYCLGLCASGPAALLDESPRARLVGARLAALLAEASA